MSFQCLYPNMRADAQTEKPIRIAVPSSPPHPPTMPCQPRPNAPSQHNSPSPSHPAFPYQSRCGTPARAVANVGIFPRVPKKLRLTPATESRVSTLQGLRVALCDCDAVYRDLGIAGLAILFLPAASSGRDGYDCITELSANAI